MPRLPRPAASWPSLTDAPDLYPDARNRSNRGPYLYRAGRVWPLPRRPDVEGRVALLAVGSNAYPRQLADKLAGTDADLQGVPTAPVILSDCDVAWCPVRSRKGYVPVTLAERPGAICLTWLQWLTPEQLDIVSATEGPRYDLVGGAELASRLRLNPRLERPERVYAWWFDSVLEASGETLWLDVWRRQNSGDLGADIDLTQARPNPPPASWTQVPRDPAGHSIGLHITAEL